MTTFCYRRIAGRVMAGGARVAREELDEAPSVAMAMNASAALFYSTRALDCFAETSLPEPPAA